MLLLLSIIICIIVTGAESRDPLVVPPTSPWHYSCHDEDLSCPQLIQNGSCFGKELQPDGTIALSVKLGIDTLSKCRASCKNLIDSIPESKREEGIRRYLKLSGGAEDTYTDNFGYVHQICDLREGFDHRSRKDLILSGFTSKVVHVNGDVFHEGAPGRLTKVGFQKEPIPEELFKKIKANHNQIVTNDEWAREVNCKPGSHICYRIGDTGAECHLTNITLMTIAGLHQSTLVAINETLQPLAEAWADKGGYSKGAIQLRITSIYGVRRYLRGQMMAGHLDKPETHVISAILNIAQDVDDPWPLDILDWDGIPRKMYLEPGEMLWYESARLPHGRVQRLNGNYFDNVFVHFMPEKGK